MHSLPLFHRLTGQKVILLAEGEAGEAKRRLLQRAGAEIVGEEDAAARLAFVALAKPDAAAERLRCRGLLINVADRPDLCDFTLPSILERGPVLIAIGTGGASAGLAKALRMRLEAMLPQSLGRLATALAEARVRLRAIWPEAAIRRKQIDAALAPGGLLDPLRDFASERLEAWLQAASSSGMFGHGTRIEITLNIDDPDDLSVREARSLANADLIIHDPSVPVAFLALSRADAARCLTGEEPAEGNYPLTVVIRQG